jgi:hypothetical protein
MKNISKILISSLTAVSIISCAGTGTKVRTDGAFDKRTAGEARFTALDDGEDRNVVTQNVPEAKEDAEAGKNPVIETRKAQSKQSEQYFSVQVYASKSSSDAEQFKNSISGIFPDEVAIDYQAPYYRVCIGKTSGYERGEELLKKVNAQGFPKAWLVRVRK